MKISAAMNLDMLMERMGTEATRDDAERMRELLISDGFSGTDTNDIPDDVWISMLGAVCCVAEDEQAAHDAR